MALRIKCKCGKSLKIPTSLAGKKLACPACKKPFRISAEKFEKAAAAPSAGKPGMKRATPKPAEAPMPAPVELDILPANLDWSGELDHSQSDILSDLIPDVGAPASTAADLSGPGCPSCKQTLPQGAKLCVNCGFDLRTGKAIAGATATPVAAAAVPVAKPVSASAEPAAPATYASDRMFSGTGLRSATDVIQRPKRSFWADAFHSFAYPFCTGGNAVTFSIILFFNLLQIPLGYVGCLGAIGQFFITGWIWAVYLSIVQDTATASIDLPGIKMEEGPVEDIVKPFFRYLGAAAFSFLPATSYLILMSSGVLPDSLTSPFNLLILAAAGVFLWPVFVMLFAFNALAMIIRVDLIFTTIFRTFLPYLSLWLMLVLVSVLTMLPLVGLIITMSGLNIAMPNLPDFGRFGMVGEGVIGLYVNIVSMRLIGLYYLHFKRRFTLVME
ncbi:MAG: hypothetical protein ABII12_15915 [Planctomycetota bacterium]